MSPLPPQRTSMRAVLWLCYGAMMSLAIAVNLTPVYLTTFGETFGGEAGLTPEQLGRIPAVLIGSLTLGILLSGPLADRWGAKLFAMLGLGFTCAGLGLMAAAASYAVLLVSGCLMGLGAGILDMVLSPIVCALEPHRRASAMNWLHSFFCTGALATVLLGAFAIRMHIPWRTLVTVVILFPAAVFAGFALTSVPSLVATAGKRTPLSRLMLLPFFIAALIAILLGGAAEQGLAQWLPAFAERSLGYTRETAALGLAAFLVAMSAGRMLAAILGRHVKAILMMIVCCVICVALLLVACFVPWPGAALAACIGVGLAGSCFWPTMLGVTGDRFPNGGASMFALLAAFGNAGCFIMPWVVGVVAGRVSLNWGLATVALCPALMAGVLLWMYRRPADAA